MLNMTLEQARTKAEETIGFKIPDSTADYILDYTKRKFERITEQDEKPEGYLAVLYLNEIEDHYTRLALSSISEMARREEAYVLCM